MGAHYDLLDALCCLSLNDSISFMRGISFVLCHEWPDVLFRVVCTFKPEFGANNDETIFNCVFAIVEVTTQ
jgi:hypothetical protein